MNTQAKQLTAPVRMTGLHKAFGNNRVLRGMDLELNPGENLVVIGRSGCGKSILLKCVIGLVSPDEGEIWIFSEDSSGFSRADWIRVRSRIGFLFQSNALYDSMNVKENLCFTLQRKNRNLGALQMNSLVDEVLENVGLPGTGMLMPSELSGGMKKRIGLARAMILKPELMLYDEPTTGLDPITSREISRLILQLQEIYKMSSIIISHDLQCVEMTADRILVLMDGICAANGTYEAISQSPDPRVNAFFTESWKEKK